jgi:hypothetical protein
MVNIDINSVGSNPYNEINLFGRRSGMELQRESGRV